MKGIAITTAVCLALLGGRSHRLAFCGVHWTPDERVIAEDSAASPGEAALPSNVSVPIYVKRVLQAVWKRSPTFRQQYRRIREARNLRIEVYLVFEHVLEQLEGLDLKALAAQENSGVSRNELGAYETARAVNAGRRVPDEYRCGDDFQALSLAQRPAQSPPQSRLNY